MTELVNRLLRAAWRPIWATSQRVIGVTDWIGNQLHISSRWASRAGFLVLFGLGMGFVQVDEYLLALASWVIAAVVLFSKAVHWQGFAGRVWLTRIWRAVYVLAAIALIPTFVIWINLKRGDKPWTAFARSRPFVAANRIDTEPTPLPKLDHQPPDQAAPKPHAPILPVQALNRSHLHVITIVGELTATTHTVTIGLINDGTVQADVLTNQFESRVGPFPQSPNIEVSVAAEVKLENGFSQEFEGRHPRPSERGNALLNELPAQAPRTIDNSQEVQIDKISCVKSGACGYWIIGRFDYFDHNSNQPRFTSYCGVFHSSAFIFCHGYNQEP